MNNPVVETAALAGTDGIPESGFGKDRVLTCLLDAQGGASTELVVWDKNALAGALVARVQGLLGQMEFGES